MRLRTNALLTLCGVLPLLACRSEPTPLDAQDAAEAALVITGEGLRERVSVIAADSMMGRDTPSPGLDATARWIASEFQAMGLRPAFSGSFEQRYAIQTVVADGAASSVTANGPLAFGEDLSFAVGPVRGTFAGDVVVVSGSAEGLGEGAGLAGRHVILVPAPGAVGLRDAGVAALYRAVRAQEPAAILLASDRTTVAWTEAWRRRTERPQVVVGGLEPEGPPVFEIRDAAVERLLSTAGVDLGAARARAGDSFQMMETGLHWSLTPAVRVLDESTAPNVAGILEGSDPVLRDEYVVYSAHMDHVGVGPPDPAGDSIFNGADDDASGTATIMEVAEAFSRLPTAPARSLIFVAVSGEEKGLWGSDYFAARPPVPLDALVADLNVDMVGRNWPDSIVAIGREHSDLGATLEEVNRAHPELGMTALDDIWPEENFYFRSDHFNFARRGVPVLFFFNGTHPDYHGVDDEVERLDVEKASRIGRLLFYLGLEVAQRPARPEWNPQSYARIVTGR